MTKPRTAILLYTCGMPSLALCLSSVLKYLPGDIPIFLINNANPCVATEELNRRRIQTAVERAQGRLHLIEPWCRNHPRNILHFCQEHREFQFIWKMDDDIFYTDVETWDGVIAGYQGHADAILATGITPIQQGVLPLLVERAGLDLPATLVTHSHKLSKFLKQQPEMVSTIWDATLPPEGLQAKLKAHPGPRYVVVDNAQVGTDYSVGHYYAARRDIIAAYADTLREDSGIHQEFRWGDERGLNAMRRRDNRAVVVDTHSLVYHLAWYPARSWSEDHILPKLMRLPTWQ